MPFRDEVKVSATLTVRNTSVAAAMENFANPICIPPPNTDPTARAIHCLGPSTLCVFPRHPENVRASVVVGLTRKNEQQIGESVDVFQCVRVHRFLHRERCHGPFGPAADGACEMKTGRQIYSASQDERFQGVQSIVRVIDFPFQTFDLVGLHAKAAVRVIVTRSRNISAEIEQVVLDPGQDLVGFAAAAVAPRQTDRSVGLVDVALGGNPHAVFRDPAAVPQ